MSHMILHVSCDDQFVRYVDKQFMEGLSSSRLVVCDYLEVPRFAKHAPRMEYIQTHTKAFEELKCSLGRYDAIIFHGLFGAWSTELLDSVPDGVKVGWVCWDAEVFSRPDMINKYLQPLTLRVKKAKSIYSFLRNGFNTNHAYFVPKDRFHKIDYCLCDMEQEVEAANNYFGTQMEWIPYNYYSINDTLGKLRDKRVDGPNVFLGNACTYNNNQIDALWKLRGLVNATQKVITPLSYGDMGLKKHVLNAGNLFLKNSFMPLVNFMSLEDYNAKMLSCSTMIQNHGSPAGLGNIVTGLWLGMRVYLSKRNVTYYFLKSLGAHIYLVEDDLNRKNPNVFTPLTDEEVTHNRTVLESFYGDEVIRQRVENIIKKMI